MTSTQEAPKPLKPFTLKVEESDIENLKKYAKNKGRSTQGQIRYIIKLFLANPQEPQLQINIATEAAA